MTQEKFAPPAGAKVDEFHFTVKERHLDSFGHVNNAAYLEIFEEARWEIVTARGFGLKEVIQRQIGPTILDIQLRFRRELRNREAVLVRTWVEKHSGKITVLRQVMINEKAEVACVADFTIGLFDMAQRRLIEASPEWKYALSIS